ncbi:Hypothetical protein SCF082_LOCUS31131 [Durusdinium trenchii]|uniref:ADF-H domain-containing protein n=1 Tax=Durusdinium trenchii TaxID=1381693 RepID=A0ABP0N3M1_9DINO
MTVTFPAEADEVIQALMDDKNPETDFVVFTMEGKNEMVLEDGNSGRGGRDKVQEILEANEDKVMCGAFLVLAVDDREVTMSIRRKYIHFIYVGGSVGVMAKGRVNSQSGDMINKFPQCSMYVQLMGDFDDLSEEAIEKSLRASGGAHQPTKFDFTNTATEEA